MDEAVHPRPTGADVQHAREAHAASSAAPGALPSAWDALPEAIALLDPAGRVVGTNAAATAPFMAESADILTADHQQVILPDLAAGCSMGFAFSGPGWNSSAASACSSVSRPLYATRAASSPATAFSASTCAAASLFSGASNVRETKQ